MESLHGPINACIFGEEGKLNGGGVLEEWSSFEMEDKMPFLQMLQSVETPSSVSCVAESSSSFQQLVLKLQQHQKRPWAGQSNQLHTDESKMEAKVSSTSPQVNKRKRKKTRPPKNKDEMESHRMTHIAVERNRRRQMNDHLGELRSLMPPSYVQRGDQASIIGGAIDFIKELEQLLESLQAQKRLRKGATSSTERCEDSISCSSSLPCSSNLTQNERKPDENGGEDYEGGGRTGGGGGLRAESKSMVADVQVTLIHNHVNLKIHCGNRPGQLVKAVLALEDLRLTVLHLNVTSLETSVYYSFSLKIEDDCKLRSAIEIAETIHEMFRLIHGC